MQMEKHVVAFLRKKHVAYSSFLEKPQCVGQHGAGDPLVEMLKVV